MNYRGSKTVLLEPDSCEPKGNSGYSTGSQGYTACAPSLNPNLLTYTPRNRPTITQTRGRSTITQTRDRPTTTTQTRKPPTISQTRVRPTTTQTRDRPTTTQTRDRPTTTQTRDRPTTTQTRDRPTTTQTRDRPTTTQTRVRPTTTQTRDRPTTTQTRKPKTILQSPMMHEVSEAVSQIRLNRSGDGAWSSLLLKVPVLIPKTRAVRVTTLLQTQDPDTVFSSLRRHNPELRKWTSRQFPGSAFEYVLKNANFNKLHQEFSEVFRLKKLITLGDSVCALYVGDICQGSGFMLAGNLIMTNAHLLENALLEDGKTLAVQVKALFNHENDPIESEALLMYEAYSGVIDLDKEMDYAVLRLIKRDAEPMPPGLLPYFGPKPNSGGACIIGHPGDQVKKIDLTYVIGKNEREAAANQHLEPYDESARMVIVKEAVESGINDIWSSEEVITYNTVSMFHGSSGSPLMDTNGRVVGIHSAGFVYEFEGLKHSVIEYAHPTLQIFARFLSNIGPLDMEDVVQLSSTNLYLRDLILEYQML